MPQRHILCIVRHLYYVTNLGSWGSKYDIARYEIDFEICIFARDKAQENLLKIASIIEDLIKPEILSNKEYSASEY